MASLTCLVKDVAESSTSQDLVAIQSSRQELDIAELPITALIQHFH